MTKHALWAIQPQFAERERADDSAYRRLAPPSICNLAASNTCDGILDLGESIFCRLININVGQFGISSAAMAQSTIAGQSKFYCLSERHHTDSNVLSPNAELLKATIFSGSRY